jgi:hypothetical protein
VIKPQYIVDQLKKLGYEIKKSSGNRVDVVVTEDRVTTLRKFAELFNGTYNASDRGSSIGGTIVGNVKIYAKPKGGGSGAGSEATKLTESAQCLYLAATYYGKDYSSAELNKAARHIDVDETLNNMLTKLDESWIDSCITTAKLLRSKHRGTYTFHRGSSWVQRLENKWKELNRSEDVFSNLNKWSPADIYMLTETGKRENFSGCNSIIELNAVMKKMFSSGDIIGVSLKKVGGSASYSIKNMTNDRATYEYSDLSIGKRGFFLSNDGYLYFNGGSIQFRTFGTTWQGEIKGKTANMGKISGGPLISIMKRIGGVDIKPQKDIKEKTQALVDDMYEFYKGLGAGNINLESFITEVNKKDQTFWVSKWMSAQLLYHISKMQKDKKDAVVGAIISYAASESDLSGPYCKIS